MSKHLPASAFQRVAPPVAINAILPAAGPDHSVRVVRSFDLPNGLFAATVALYFAYLGVMGATFASRFVRANNASISMSSIEQP